MRSILGLGAALALASFGAVHNERVTTRQPGPHMGWPFDDEGRYIPNDHGQVIDTTPESKRARRRRLAKQGR